MADMGRMRVEVVFMMREFLSFELERALKDFCASLGMFLSTVRALGQ
jgi:hypothetical protein